MRLARPRAEEAAPYFQRYVDEVPGDDVLAILARQPDEIATLLAQVPPEREDHRYAPGKWSIKDVVQHLSDAERIFVCRALRFARGDRTELPGFDENAYADHTELGQRSLARVLAEFAHVRAATLAFTGGLTSRDWDRAGTANGTVMSVRATAWVIAGHTHHHARVLAERYL